VLGIQAQTVRTISVAQGKSYTDHISLKPDTKDMDLMVKFVFNEEANTLSVTLISYRSLMVFWDDVHFKPLMKGRKLRPAQLPYVVAFDPADKYRITKLVKASIPKPHKMYVFKRWIDYKGLQPTPTEYKMENDFITQTFDIQNKRTQVDVTLHDVFLIDKTEKKKYNLYEIPFGRDLNLQYQVTIERNPCFGLDTDIESAKKALDGVSKSYSSLKTKYGSGQVGSQESLKIFNDMKSTIQNQFQKDSVNGQSPCPDVQSAWAQYNQYVDSIAAMKVVVVGPTGVGGGGISPDDIKVLLMKARQIDSSVARWLVSTDPIEREDLIKEAQNYIKTGIDLLGGRKGVTAEQKQAVSTFRAAERYFNNTCFPLTKK
jgi:hypothetical protein